MHSVVVKSESKKIPVLQRFCGRPVAECGLTQTRPICSQCRDSKLRCEWPRQQKRYAYLKGQTRPPCLDSGLINRTNTCRGLPKHHIRKLEARLRRTETLLRSLLHFVSDEQLESSLRDVAPMAIMGSAQDKENADPDVWQFYPLTTLEDVRAWQSRTAGPGLSEIPPTAPISDPNREDPLDDDSVPSQHGGSSRQGDYSPCLIPNEAASPIAKARTLQVDHSSANSHSISGATSRGGSHALLDAGVAEMTRMDERSPVASTFLPADFQKEFLW